MITCKGKLGLLGQNFYSCTALTITLVDNKILITSDFPRQGTIALAGTVRNILKNMILGVTEGYTYKMKIVLRHFPISVDVPKDRTENCR